MTLRTCSLRIDPVAVALDGECVIAGEEPRHGGEAVEPLVAGAAPRVPEDDDGRGPAALEVARELVAKRLDGGVRLVVEEVEVVEETRRLSEMQAQQRVHAAFRDVHDLHGAGARERPRSEEHTTELQSRPQLIF